jgi:hypothetical protein
MVIEILMWKSFINVYIEIINYIKVRRNIFENQKEKVK